MTRIIYVPIEPLTERYSEQWYRRFPTLFKDAGFDVVVLNGVPLLQDDIKVGAFLDINSTIHYKMSQLQDISRLFYNKYFKDGDIFFFGDVEFWGLESVRLMAQMNNVKVKITGFLHAASYTLEDAFAVAEDYQKYTEVGWFAALDKVFVGSEYHKEAVLSRRVRPIANTFDERDFYEKIVVTKNPIFLDEYVDFNGMGVKKKKKMILTNRLDPEKRPIQTLNLFRDLKKKFPDWEFVVTTGRKALRADTPETLCANVLAQEGVITLKVGLTKDEYHRELAESAIMVSHSIEENYGYCIAEALIYDCIPLLRQGLSHDEFVNDECMLFNGHDDGSDYAAAIHLMNAFGTKDWPACPTLDTDGANRIVDELKMLC